MTWTYTAQPQNVKIDAVRLTIGDTDTNDQQLQDEEIQYFIDTNNQDILIASIAAARALQGRYSRQADEVTGEVEVKFSQRAKAYKELVLQLEEKFNSHINNNPVPFAGGISIADIDNNLSNPDRPRELFQIDMHVNNDIFPGQ